MKRQRKSMVGEQVPLRVMTGTGTCPSTPSKRRAAFTLIELIAALALMAMLLTALLASSSSAPRKAGSTHALATARAPMCGPTRVS